MKLILSSLALWISDNLFQQYEAVYDNSCLLTLKPSTLVLDPSFSCLAMDFISCFHSLLIFPFPSLFEKLVYYGVSTEETRCLHPDFVASQLGNLAKFTFLCPRSLSAYIKWHQVSHKFQ